MKNTITILKRSTEFTDKELIEKCIKNNRKAQKRLYEKYCNAMYSTSYRIMKDREEAQDVLQEAFVQVFRDIRHFRMESTLGNWIKTIVVRAALKKLRGRIRFESLDDSMDSYQHETLVYINAEHLEKAILSLPSGYRTVFLLVEVEGYGHKEVADMLDITEGTSKSQLSRAKKMLKRLLTPQYED